MPGPAADRRSGANGFSPESPDRQSVTYSAATALPLRIAATATAIDGLGAVAYGCWQLVAIATRPRGTALGVAALGGVLFILFGAGLAAVARTLWRGRRRGRAPAVVTHLVALLLVPGLIRGGTWWLGIPLGVLAVAAVVGMFLPSSTRIFGSGRRTGR